MADYSITAANVLASSGVTPGTGVAGATIAAGDVLYIDASDSNKLKLADANLSAAASTVAGIARHGASAGQPIQYAAADPDFTHGLTGVAAGDIIVLSATAGKLAPAADVASTWYPVVMMVATSSTKAVLKIVQGTAAKA